MRGGASLKGKGGRVGFRKIPLFNGKEVREDGWVFEKFPSLMVKRDGVILEKTLSIVSRI